MDGSRAGRDLARSAPAGPFRCAQPPPRLSVPTAGRSPLPLRPLQRVRKFPWSRLPRGGFHTGRQRGRTPLRMLPTCRPRPLGHRGGDRGISLLGAKAELRSTVPPAPLPPWWHQGGVFGGLQGEGSSRGRGNLRETAASTPPSVFWGAQEGAAGTVTNAMALPPERRRHRAARQ